MAPDTLNVSWPNCVIFQQDLVVYLENLLRKAIVCHVSHTISGEYVWSNDLLLQSILCVALCHVKIIFFIEYIFCKFNQGRWKGYDIS